MMIFQKPKVDASRQFLQKLNPKPKVLVELGGYVGKSAVAWGDLLRSFHTNNGEVKDVKVFSLELEPDFVPIIRDFVSISGLEGIVEVVQGPSQESLRILKNERGIDKIDVLFLDHWEDRYLPDLRTVEELGMLKVGSVLVADNTDMPGTPDYLKYVEAGGEGGFKYRCESVVVDAPDGAPVSSDSVDEKVWTLTNL